MNYLNNLPKDRIEIKTWKQVFLLIMEKIHKKQLVIERILMALPIKEQTELAFASTHETNMHACGHDFHMSIALGVLTYFVENPIDDNLLFIFQPAEEGPGGAEPMLKSETMKKWKPDMIIALHIAPEYPVGTIAIKEGLLFANTSELFIDLKGKGGHAAYPHETNDMVITACQLVGQLQSVVSRNIDPLDSAVITIGKIKSGTVQNIIAEEARLEGTIRTLNAKSMEKVKSRISAIVEGIKMGFECEAKIDFGAMYYQVDNEEQLTREFMKFMMNQME